MAYAKVPIRLAARRQLDKADVESIYAEIVKVVGGTYFLNGVAQGPANGTMDWRNLDPDAGITNLYKANPNSIFCIPIQPIGGFSAPATFYQGISGFVETLPTGLQIVGVSLTYHSISGATNSGTVQFQYLRNGAATNVGTAINWTNAAVTPTILSNQTGLSVPLQAGDELVMALTAVGGGASIFLLGQFWLKAAHTSG